MTPRQPEVPKEIRCMQLPPERECIEYVGKKKGARRRQKGLLEPHSGPLRAELQNINPSILRSQEELKKLWIFIVDFFLSKLLQLTYSPITQGNRRLYHAVSDRTSRRRVHLPGETGLRLY
jgi:hypothetical protein